MSLASLKKRGPSTKKKAQVSLDDFIQDAERYAKGMPQKVVPLSEKNTDKKSDCSLKKATFTLGDKAIEQLNQLSQETGIAKSRLIRIWLDSLDKDKDSEDYIASQTP